MQEILTIDQVADVLLCDKDTAAACLNSGELPGLKFGRSWVIPAVSFYQRLNELAIEAANERRNKSLPNVRFQGGQPQKKRGRPRFNFQE